MGNNPQTWVDPTGLIVRNVERTVNQQDSIDNVLLGNGGEEKNERIIDFGCVLTAFVRIARELSGKEFTLEEANYLAVNQKIYENGNELSPRAGVRLVNALVNNPKKTLLFTESIEGNGSELGSKLNELDNSLLQYFTSGRINTTDSTGTKKYDHQVNINSNSLSAGDISDMDNPFTFKLADTSTVDRQSTNDTSRSNKLFRVDIFRVEDTSWKQYAGENYNENVETNNE